MKSLWYKHYFENKRGVEIISLADIHQGVKIYNIVISTSRAELVTARGIRLDFCTVSEPK